MDVLAFVYNCIPYFIGLFILVIVSWKGRESRRMLGLRDCPTWVGAVQSWLNSSRGALCTPTNLCMIEQVRKCLQKQLRPQIRVHISIFGNVMVMP